ncbi:MAG: hypothetical protein JRG96_17480 [Deltaproteobacteria bacterium]|nr:hypothetical protein [Deltaproteobacteria bacterium]MBW2418900.1 hypothetical protein [Deltaproteobacteria bacterium]
MRGISLALALGLAVACAMGTDVTRTVDDAPTLAVSGAPEGTTLFVDGIYFGPTESFSTLTPVEVLPGAHVVEIRRGATTLHREEVFTGTGSTTTVSVSNAQ